MKDKEVICEICDIRIAIERELDAAPDKGPPEKCRFPETGASILEYAAHNMPKNLFTELRNISVASQDAKEQVLNLIKYCRWNNKITGYDYSSIVRIASQKLKLRDDEILDMCSFFRPDMQVLAARNEVEWDKLCGMAQGDRQMAKTPAFKIHFIIDGEEEDATVLIETQCGSHVSRPIKNKIADLLNKRMFVEWEKNWKQAYEKIKRCSVTPIPEDGDVVLRAQISIKEDGEYEWKEWNWAYETMCRTISGQAVRDIVAVLKGEQHED